MSYYPGSQPPQDPYRGQPAGDPYAPPPQPSDPYLGQSGADPYAPTPEQAWAQQQAWYAQQQAWYAQQQAAATARAAETRGGRGGAGAAIVGLLLVAAGAWILFGDQIDLDLGEVWPVGAVAIGVLMVIAAFIPRGEA